MLLQYGVCYGCRGGKLYCADAVPAYCIGAMKLYCVFAGWAYSVVLRFDMKIVTLLHAFLHFAWTQSGSIWGNRRPF